MEKITFFVKVVPPRTTFAHDMSEGERAIMQRHVAYWIELMNTGKAIVFGPVMDPTGVYGVGIARVGNSTELEAIIANDPAKGLNTYHYYPMHAIIHGIS